MMVGAAAAQTPRRAAARAQPATAAGAPASLQVDGLQAHRRPRHAGRARPEPDGARRRDPRRGRRLRQRPARAGRGAGRPARARRRAACSVHGRALCRARASENHRLQGAQPARGAAAQRLRRRPERGREHGAARLRPRRRWRAAGGCASRRWRSRARDWIAAYGIKTQGEDAPIRSLSGGNVQRAVLARELAGDINVLIAANPVFGLDFAAVAEIHAPHRAARASAAAPCC